MDSISAVRTVFETVGTQYRAEPPVWILSKRDLGSGTTDAAAVIL